MPVSTDSLIFPSAFHNLSQTLSSLKRSRLSIHNRLASIYQDSQFAQKVSDIHKLPLVANERCGSWYIPTEKKVGSAYFKSTDGHQGEWRFSLRRLNLQILEIIGEYDGCIIVDSTRSGKSMPDALSKTIPIWCAVMNRLLFSDVAACHALRTPPEVVGRSEHSQIEARLESFVESAKELQLDIKSLRAKLRRPLYPRWITQASSCQQPLREGDYHMVICCTTSRQEETTIWTDGYIQGAGDDSEGWSHGLTPTVFWQNLALLLSASREDDGILRLLAGLESTTLSLPAVSDVTEIYPAGGPLPIFIGRRGLSYNIGVEAIISCDDDAFGFTPPGSKSEIQPLRLRLESRTGKLGSRTLRDQLPRIMPFIEKLSLQASVPRLLFVCATGRDLSVGVALTVLCLYFNDCGK
ncbi:hypothetical protein MMC13_007345 [Lambiella insularis]|nr:hypothetical protein [Lambiella insularis]